MVITTGTFLGGECHIGDDRQFKAGRFMRHTDTDSQGKMKIEPASLALSDSIKRLEFPVGRLRTGTPPRLSRATIDYTGLEEQKSDPVIQWFSFSHLFNGFEMQNGEIHCNLTRTNAQTHEIINAGYHRAPKLGDDGRSYGTGPRYCPTIEKKLWMFADKDAHNIWLEPEGLESDVVYPNGLSTGLPLDY